MIGYFRNMLPAYRFAFFLLVVGAGVVAYAAGQSRGLWYGVGVAGYETMALAVIVAATEIWKNA